MSAQITASARPQMSVGTKVSNFCFFCPDLNPFAPPALVPLVAAVREPAGHLLLNAPNVLPLV
jgi:hypothetical protein